MLHKFLRKGGHVERKKPKETKTRHKKQKFFFLKGLHAGILSIFA
jgi:hypothetical protein